MEQENIALLQLLPKHFVATNVKQGWCLNIFRRIEAKFEEAPTMLLTNQRCIPIKEQA